MTSSAARKLLTRPRELAQLCASGAAISFGRLIGRPVGAREPLLARAAATEDAATGIVFEVEGPVSGVVALLLSREARDAVWRTLGVGDDAETRRSALREVGNIVASHAISAVADHLGARITLSVPLLMSDGAGRTLDRLLARRGDRVVSTTELRGEPSALLVFAHDAP